MILVKIRGQDDESTYLRNIKAVKLSFQNKIPRENGPRTEGWQTFLRDAVEDRNIALRMRGILCNSKAESILSTAALFSTSILGEITLINGMKEIINAEFFVELYEKDCEAGELECFSVVLVSNGKVEHSTSII